MLVRIVRILGYPHVSAFIASLMRLLLRSTLGITYLWEIEYRGNMENTYTPYMPYPHRVYSIPHIGI